jgi:PAS domain S-box-containing protein
MDVGLNRPEDLCHPVVETLVELFEEFPETLFWIKDAELRIVGLNQAFADRVGRPRREILGRTDAAFYFAEMAKVFMEDDARVIRTGEPVLNKTELLANLDGEIEWRLTTKRPLRDNNGTIWGTTGISRPLLRDGESLPEPYQAFDALVQTMRENLTTGLALGEIARRVGMSRATLGRRFGQAFGISPGAFMQQLRLSRACRCLTHSTDSITEISMACGYESAAAFTRAFRRQMGVAPSGYRQSKGG